VCPQCNTANPNCKGRGARLDNAHYYLPVMTEQQITEGVSRAMFPEAQWESPNLAYVKCPGQSLHTSSNGRRDCRLTINDGMVPTLYCCHSSCSDTIASSNRELRSAIGKLKTSTSSQLAKLNSVTLRTKPVASVPVPAIKKSLIPESLPQPMKSGQELHLSSCFRPDELCSIVFGQGAEGKPLGRGQTMPPLPLEVAHPLGTYIRVNPMQEGGASDSEVASYRHCLIECDSASLDLQYSAIVQSNLPISVVVFSGKRSVHAWVRVEASTAQEFRERARAAADAMEEFDGIKVDRATLNPSRLARLAGCDRGDSRQELLAINLGAECWDSWVAARKPTPLPQAEVVTEPEKSTFFYRKRSKDYLQWVNTGKILPLSETACRMMMRLEGHVVDNDKNGMDIAIANVMIENGLDYDGSMPGYRLGLHEERGARYFADSQARWLDGITPNAKAQTGKGWETIYGLLQGLFVVNDSWKQFFHFIATLKQSRDCLKLALQGYGEQRQVRSGQATVLCGPKACGKSFLINKVVVPLLGGRSQDAHKAFAAGPEGFNGELLNGEVWVIDDKEHATNIATRRQFASSIKSFLYSGLVGFHPKHKTQITICPFARLFILCNDQDDAIKVLPPLTDDISDKIHLFRCGFAMPAMSTAGNDEWKKYGDTIESELPAFAGWVDASTIPARLLDPRSGVTCYQDPYVVSLLASQTPEHQVAQLLVYALGRGMLRNQGKMTSRMVLDDLRDDEGMEAQSRGLFHGDPMLLGKYLGRIVADQGRYIREMGLYVDRSTAVRGVVEWKIELQ